MGSLDLDDDYLDRLDIAIAGIHGKCWAGGDKKQNTKGMIAVINNPKIHVIGHPGDGTAEMDFEQLVLASKDSHTLLKINNHSLAPQRKKTVAITNSLEILRLCKKHDVPLILSSDAHIFFQITDCSRIMPLVEEVGFPDELIMNYWSEQSFQYVGINTKPQ